MSKPPRLNGPKCKLPSCENLVNWSRSKGVGWKSYCSGNCSSKYKSAILLDEKLSLPIKICNNPYCNNIVSIRNKYSHVWLDQCSLECKRIVDQIKIKSTNIQRYGVENVMQCDSIFASNIKSNKRFKDYILPSGKIVRIQGNENLALDQLLQTYQEAEIICDRSLVPKFWYGKKKYYPDIYIPKDNLIIEVKSKWTYNGKPEWLESNLLKQQACLDAGYNFKFMIY